MKAITKLSLTQKEKDFLKQIADFFVQLDQIDETRDIADNLLTYQPATFEDLASLMIEISDFADTEKERK